MEIIKLIKYWKERLRDITDKFFKKREYYNTEKIEDIIEVIKKK